MLGLLGWCVIFIYLSIFNSPGLFSEWKGQSIRLAWSMALSETHHLWEGGGGAGLSPQSTSGVLLSYSHYNSCFGWHGTGLYFWHRAVFLAQGCSLTSSRAADFQASRAHLDISVAAGAGGCWAGDTGTLSPPAWPRGGAAPTVGRLQRRFGHERGWKAGCVWGVCCSCPRTSWQTSSGSRLGNAVCSSLPHSLPPSLLLFGLLIWFISCEVQD